VIAKSYARIGFQNLVNYGIIPFLFENPADYDRLEKEDVLSFERVTDSIRENLPVKVVNLSREMIFNVNVELTTRQRNVLLAGGLINILRRSV